MISSKKQGVVFWAAVAVGMTIVLAVTVIMTAGMILGLMHFDGHALLWMADLQAARRCRARLTPALDTFRRD